MSPKFVLFVFAFIAWCLFNWVPDSTHMLVGIPVAGLVSYLMGDLVIERPHLLGNLRRYSYFIFLYVPVFLWEVIKANIDVACRVIHPNLPIRPGIVKVRTSLQSDIAITLLANSITLTPGTMSVDIDKDKGVLYIHWINISSDDVEEATSTIVQRFEKILQNIFEEEAANENN